MPIVSRCKCMVVGDAAVGKTSIVNVLLGPPNRFSKQYLMTRGIDITSKSLRLPDSDDAVELFIYDCSGRRAYNEIIEKICSSNVSFVVAVFDVTDEKTFHSLQTRLQELFKVINKPTIGVLLGNKSDLAHQRMVSSDESHQLAKKHKMRYFDCSAKEMNGIEDSFLHLVTAWQISSQK